MEHAIAWTTAHDPGFDSLYEPTRLLDYNYYRPPSTARLLGRKIPTMGLNRSAVALTVGFVRVGTGGKHSRPHAW